MSHAAVVAFWVLVFGIVAFALCGCRDLDRFDVAQKCIVTICSAPCLNGVHRAQPDCVDCETRCHVQAEKEIP